MKKPANWDTTQAFTGEFKTLPPGGHICVIKQAKVDTTQNGKEVMILLFDIAEGDFKGYYQEQYDNRVKNNADAKYQGVFRQLTEDNSLPFFKGMLTAIEDSNPGYKWNWDEKTLKGKLFGGIFGQEEYLNNNGEVKLVTKCQWVRSVDSVRKGVEVPKIKELKNKPAGNSFGADVFPEEEIPF